ncbi:uncharacterized protein METZ01_LOCUS355384, partial [marine metagenome]
MTYTDVYINVSIARLSICLLRSATVPRHGTLSPESHVDPRAPVIDRVVF